MTDQRDDRRLGFLDSLRGLAIYMVVCIHTLSYCLAMPHDLHRIVSFIVHTVAVPVFFMVDGYLFAHTKDGQKQFHFLPYIRQSAFRLLVPWIIFTITYALARYVFELVGFFDESIVVGAGLKQVVIYGYQSVFAPQMYFLVSLFLIRLASPLYHAMLSWKIGHMLVLVVVLYVAYRFSIDIVKSALTIEGGLEPVSHALWGLQFYLAGMVVYRLQLLSHKTALLCLCCILFAVMMVLEPSSAMLVRYKVYLVQFLYLLTLFFLFAHVRHSLSLLRVLGVSSMGIFLLHAPVLLKVLSLAINRLVDDPLISFLSISVLATAASYAVMTMISKVPYGSVLFGVPYGESRLSRGGASDG